MIKVRELFRDTNSTEFVIVTIPTVLGLTQIAIYLIFFQIKVHFVTDVVDVLVDLLLHNYVTFSLENSSISSSMRIVVSLHLLPDLS